MQRWDEFSELAKIAIVLTAVWLLVWPFLAGWLRLPGDMVSVFVGVLFHL